MLSMDDDLFLAGLRQCLTDYSKYFNWRRHQWSFIHLLSYYWIGQRVHFGFFLTSMEKPEQSFWPTQYMNSWRHKWDLKPENWLLSHYISNEYLPCVNYSTQSFITSPILYHMILRNRQFIYGATETKGSNLLKFLQLESDGSDIYTLVCLIASLSPYYIASKEKC